MIKGNFFYGREINKKYLFFYKHSILISFVLIIKNIQLGNDFVKEKTNKIN